MLKKSGQKIIEDLLESDDELPSEYNEELDIPAYQNDNRFQAITFNWIDSNFSKYYGNDQNERCLSSLYSTLNEEIVHKKTENLRMGEKSIILNGVLNQQDLYCLKCVEPITSDATLLWFINFLLYKDLQSDFGFLKTCLVDVMHKKSSNSMMTLNYLERKKYNFDIVFDH